MAAGPTRAAQLARNSFSAHRPRLQPCLRCSRMPSYASTRLYHPSRRRDLSSLAAAVSAAKNAFSAPTPSPIGIDPLVAVAKEMKSLTGNIQKLLGSGHPVLNTVAKYYTQTEGKYVRPTLVLLMSRATAICPKTAQVDDSNWQDFVDQSLSPMAVLADSNPSAPQYTPLSSPLTEPIYDKTDPQILPTQRRLAEITEMIHTASLLHDDVIDNSESRRAQASANIAYGNKLAVLAGDFLLGRASIAIARLRDPVVIELLGTVLANLVEGEFMQLRNTAADSEIPVWHPSTLDYYLQKTYLKSASLISKSCRAAAVLGKCTPEVIEAAYQYGKNLGLAFQLVDDMLDYTISEAELGKPAGADLELGLATAPLLFAWESQAELGALVGRKFAGNGDVQRARLLVSQSTGLEQTRALAQAYVDKAIDSIRMFPDSEAKAGLVDMCTKVMKRRK